MNSLYVLASPIGNTKEVTPLLIEKLESLEVIFCEDTRVTSNLLKILEINNNPKLISLHKFNENEKNDIFMKYLNEVDCGLISDAGYPTISDPGYVLINECHKNNITVHVVNGPSAINHSIVQSGFCSKGFIFRGFLSKNKNEFINELKQLSKNKLPIIIFESVHRINNTISLLKEHFSNDEIYIGRELTKKFETYYVGKISNIPEQIEKGEFCLIFNPCNDSIENDQNLNNALDEIDELIKYNMKLKDACKYISNKYNLDKHLLYDIKSKK